MKCLYDVDERRKKTKLPQADVRTELMNELDADDELREEWANTMNCRRQNPRKRFKTPDTKPFTKQKSTSTAGGSARNKFCLPEDEWSPKYGQLLPLKVKIHRLTDGLLCTHVVFHSVSPPNHLLNLQDYRSDQLAITTFLQTDDTEQSEDAPGAFCNEIASPSQKSQDADQSSSTTLSGRSLVDANYPRPLPTLPLPSQRRTDSEAYAMQFLTNPANRPNFGEASNPQTPGAGRCVKMEPIESGDDRPQHSLPRVKEEGGFGCNYAQFLSTNSPYRPLSFGFI